MNKTQSGTLLIADITGYTMFLSESELEHAQEILSVLLELLIDSTRPPLIISRTAGDAVISYGIGLPAIQGQTFVELLEDTYISFRQSIEQMVLNNTCHCAACANVSVLDLKFFVHYGVFGLQRLGAHSELIGSDVNLIHRLLKNHIAETTGIRAYTVFTVAAIEALGLNEMSITMTRHAEQYEHLGEVDLYVQDMRPAWNARREASADAVPDDQITVSVAREFSLPPHLLWDALSRPEARATLMSAVSQKVLDRQAGRIAPGSEFHCDHGKRITRQRILTWRPFDTIVTEDTMPFPGVTLPVRLRLTPTESGTRLEIAAGHSRGPALMRRLVDMMIPRILPDSLAGGMEALDRQLTNSLTNPNAPEP